MHVRRSPDAFLQVLGLPASQRRTVQRPASSVPSLDARVLHSHPLAAPVADTGGGPRPFPHLEAVVIGNSARRMPRGKEFVVAFQEFRRSQSPNHLASALPEPDAVATSRSRGAGGQKVHGIVVPTSI